MRVKWLFALWAVLLVAVGLLLTTLISVSDRLFYAAEALIVCCLFFLPHSLASTLRPLDSRHAIIKTIENFVSKFFISLLKNYVVDKYIIDNF